MGILATVVASALAGLLIGGFLSLIGVGASLAVNLLISLCAGLCISASVVVAERMMVGRPAGVRILARASAVVLGTVPVTAVGLMVIGPQTGAGSLIKVAVISLTFGSVLTAIFVLLRRRFALQRELAEAQLHRAAAERGRWEAHLRMLQAQIEPHFLFNTLATLAGLIEVDPARARDLLDKLVTYLRATLSRTRAAGGTLGDEIDLAATYLDICRWRLGDRLTTEISVDPTLLGMPFPPMLLQPLVENAVRHGVEPKPGPVEISITAVRAEGGTMLRVADDGMGLKGPPGGGSGLENVRDRLVSTYGKTARLTLEERPGGGACATIVVPP